MKCENISSFCRRIMPALERAPSSDTGDDALLDSQSPESLFRTFKSHEAPTGTYDRKRSGFLKNPEEPQRFA